MTIKRTKDRIKQTGEVFTPLPLVDEILDKLPNDVWQPKKTFLDNSCGDGNFLVRVVEYKIKHGSTPTQALRTTFGVDLMEDNVKHCRQRLLKLVGDTPYHKQIVRKNIVCHDALTWDYDNWSNPKLKVVDSLIF